MLARVVAGMEIEFTYTNHKGRYAKRWARVDRIWFGETTYYPRQQWLMTAFDLDKRAQRTFAMSVMSDVREKPATIR